MSISEPELSLTQNHIIFDIWVEMQQNFTVNSHNDYSKSSFGQ